MTESTSTGGEDAEQQLYREAYEHFDAGRLDAAALAFSKLCEIDPAYAAFRYMLGLAHKYRRDWRASLDANLRSLALRDVVDESSVWNAGIAATGLDEVDEARRLWKTIGIDLPADPAEQGFG